MSDLCSIFQVSRALIINGYWCEIFSHECILNTLCVTSSKYEVPRALIKLETTSTTFYLWALKAQMHFKVLKGRPCILIDLILVYWSYLFNIYWLMHFEWIFMHLRGRLQPHKPFIKNKGAAWKSLFHQLICMIQIHKSLFWIKTSYEDIYFINQMFNLIFIHFFGKFNANLPI